MHPLVTKGLKLVQKTWKYDAACAAGLAVGYALGWIFCKKKLQEEYTKKVDKQVAEYREHLLKKVEDTLRKHVPAAEEEMTKEEAKKQVEGSFQTSSIEDFKATPEAEHTPYHKMYKGGPNLKESDSVETTEEQIGRVDSKKLNDIPREKSGKIVRGSRRSNMEQYEDTPEEERIHLNWYTEDDVLADDDGDIWDEDDTFGDGLAKWKASDNDNIVLYSNYYADKVFCVERKECSYSDIYESDIDELLGMYDEE